MVQAAKRRGINAPASMHHALIVEFLHQCRLIDILAPKTVTRVFYLTAEDKHDADEVAALLMPHDPTDWDLESTLRMPTIAEAPYAAVLYHQGSAEVVKRDSLSRWQTPNSPSEVGKNGWLADFLSGLSFCTPSLPRPGTPPDSSGRPVRDNPSDPAMGSGSILSQPSAERTWPLTFRIYKEQGFSNFLPHESELDRALAIGFAYCGAGESISRNRREQTSRAIEHTGIPYIARVHEQWGVSKPATHNQLVLPNTWESAVCTFHLPYVVHSNALYGLPSAPRDVPRVLLTPLARSLAAYLDTPGGQKSLQEFIAYLGPGPMYPENRNEVLTPQAAMKRLSRLGFDSNEAKALVAFSSAESDSSGMALISLVDRLSGRRGIDWVLSVASTLSELLAHHDLVRLVPQMRDSLSSSVSVLRQAWQTYAINSGMTMVDVCCPGNDISATDWRTDVLYWINVPWEYSAAVGIIQYIPRGTAVNIALLLSQSIMGQVASHVLRIGEVVIHCYNKGSFGCNAPLVLVANGNTAKAIAPHAEVYARQLAPAMGSCKW